MNELKFRTKIKLGKIFFRNSKPFIKLYIHKYKDDSCEIYPFLKGLYKYLINI
jgi:hypothetical protein